MVSFRLSLNVLFVSIGILLVLLVVFASQGAEADTWFGEKQEIGSSAGAFSSVPADLDSDGDLDILACGMSTDFCWFENLDGEGTWSSEILITNSYASPSSVAAADIDGDGHLDGLCAYYMDNRVSWNRWNSSLGGFDSSDTQIITLDYPIGLAIADIDRDGDLDVITGHADQFGGSGWVYWSENTAGNGTAWTNHAIDVTLTMAFDVFATDIDGNGTIDVVATEYNSIVWYSNDGSGNFGTAKSIGTHISDVGFSVTVADIDRDGDVDVAETTFNGGVQWYENQDGDGTFGAAVPLLALIEAYHVELSDMDNDGDLDVLYVSRNGNLLGWCENLDGAGGFSAARTIESSTIDAPTWVETGDIDGDGDMDIVVSASDANRFYWYENKLAPMKSNLSTSHLVNDTCPGAACADVGDLDSDGDLDIIVASETNNALYWFENTDGAGTYGARQTIGAVTIATSCDIGDIDRNGTLDAIACTYNTPSEWTWIENVNGDASVWGPGGWSSPGINSLKSICLGDIDSDGDMDFVAAAEGSDTVAWFNNTDGQGTFVIMSPYINTTALNVYSVALGDIDHNGTLDVVSASWGDSTVRWMANDGNGNFGPGNDVDVTGSKYSVSVGDIDGDGDLDIIGNDGDSACWWENTDGAGAFGSQHLLTPACSYVRSVSAADFDNDGDLDIAAASWNDATVCWWENVDGAGSFGEKQVINGTANGASWVTPGDIDRDGDMDIVFTAFTDGTVSWAENELSIDTSKAFVHNLDQDTYHESLGDAITMAASGDALQVTKQVEVYENVVIDGKVIYIVDSSFDIVGNVAIVNGGALIMDPSVVNQTGNVYVDDGTSITLDDTIWQMNCSSDREFAVQVNDTGLITLVNNSAIRSKTAFYYDVTIYGGIEVADSSIEDCWSVWLSTPSLGSIMYNATIADWNEHAINISGGAIEIMNSTLAKSGVVESLRLDNDGHVTLVNTTFNRSGVNEYMDALSDLTVKWHIRVLAENTTGAPQTGVELKLTDNANGTYDANSTTDADGLAPWWGIVEYVENQAGKVNFTKHTIAWCGNLTNYANDKDISVVEYGVHSYTIRWKPVQNLDKLIGYWDLQPAVDDADPGNRIFAYNWTYNKTNINKPLTVTGESNASTIIDGKSSVYYVLEITSDWVNFSGFKVIKSSMVFEYCAGVRVFYSDNSTVSGCNITQCMRGVSIIQSNNNSISNNTVYNGNGNGVHFEYSSNNVIEGNYVNLNDGRGVQLRWSNSNDFAWNDINGSGGLNKYSNVDIRDSSTGNTVSNNTIRNALGRGVNIVNAGDATIRDNDIIDNNLDGIRVDSINGNVSIINNTITGNNEKGIWMRTDSGNYIAYNNVSDNGRIYFGENGGGIWLTDGASDTTVIGNTVNNNLLENIYINGATNITVEDNTCKDSDHHGISVLNSQLVAIRSNTVGVGGANQIHGIEVIFSTDCNISENTVGANLLGNIVIYDADDNVVYKNNVTADNANGIHLSGYSQGNEVRENNVTGDEYGIYLEDAGPLNRIVGNSIGMVGTRGIWVEDSPDTLIYENEMLTGGWMMLIQRSDNCYVYENNFYSGAEGVYLSGSSDCVVYDNDIEGVTTGVRLEVGAKDNEVFDNVMNGSTAGVVIHSGSGVCSGNVFSRNIVTNSTQDGFRIRTNSDGNVFYENWIKDNGERPIDVYGGSDYNLFYHNYIFCSGSWRCSDDTTTNRWNESYPLGGNYWDQHAGADLYCGPGQDLTGPDGIGDLPYSADIVGGGGAQDNYPLMTQYAEPGIPGDVLITSHADGEVVKGTIAIEAIATMSDPFGIYFYVNGEYRHVDTVAPYQFILDTSILEDDVPFLVEAIVPVWGDSDSVELVPNNLVQTGSYVTVSTLKPGYSPDQDVSVLVNVTSPPAFDLMELLVRCTDPLGDRLYNSITTYPYDTQYRVIMRLPSDAELGTYAVSVEARGYYHSEYMWNSTGATTFIVSGNNTQDALSDIHGDLTDVQGQLSDISQNITDILEGIDAIQANLTQLQGDLADLNSTILDIQADIASMNQSVDATLSGLVNQLDAVNSSVNGTLASLEGNILSELAGVNSTLYQGILDSVSTITGELSGMNSSLVDQFGGLDVSSNISALEDWLALVMQQLDANLSAANETLHSHLDAMESLSTGFYNNLSSDLQGILTDLMDLESNLSAQVDAVNSSVDALSYAVENNHTLTRDEILAELESAYTILSELDANLTSHDADIADLMAALSNLLSNEASLTRDQIIENATQILSQAQVMGTELDAHDSEVKGDIDSLSGALDTLGEQTLDDIAALLSEIASHDANVTDDIEGIFGDIDSFQTTMGARLADLNATLEELENLGDILDQINTLDQDLQDAQEELSSDIEDSSTEEQTKIGLNTLLLGIVVALLAVLLLLNLVGMRKSDAKEENGIEEEETE